MITPGERCIQLEGFSPRDGYRSMGVIIRWRRGAYKILFFTVRVLKKIYKKLASLQFWLMRALWIHYARLFLLRPLILITPCIIPRLLWICLRISYPRSYHAIILKWKIKYYTAFFIVSCNALNTPLQIMVLIASWSWADFIWSGCATGFRNRLKICTLVSSSSRLSPLISNSATNDLNYLKRSFSFSLSTLLCYFSN
jgi:hypothetical protein